MFFLHYLPLLCSTFGGFYNLNSYIITLLLLFVFIWPLLEINTLIILILDGFSGLFVCTLALYNTSTLVSIKFVYFLM